MIKKPFFSDLADLPEDKRIELAGTIAEAGNIVAVCVDSEPPEKATRYIEKLTSRFKVEVIGISNGPVEGVVTIRVGPKQKVM